MLRMTSGRASFEPRLVHRTPQTLRDAQAVQSRACIRLASSEVVRTTIDDLAATRHGDHWKQWQQLAASAPPFLTPEFFTLASRFEHHPSIVVRAFDDDTLVGVLPLVRDGGRISSLRCDFTPGFDYCGTVAGVDAIWQALLADHTWNELVLDKIPADSLLAVHLPALANAAGCPSTVRLDTRHAYFPLRGFEAALSAKFRTNLQRCARKAGGIELERIEVPDRAAFDEALAIEAMAWKSRTGTSIDSDPRSAHFYRVVSRLFGRRHAGALYFLRVAGRRVATLLAVEDARTLFALKIGYDPTVANLSPGHLLVWKVAAAAEARGLQELDFVGHDDEWKRKWTDRAKEYVSIVIYRDSPQALMHFAMRQLVRPHLPPWLRGPLCEMLPRGCQRADIVGTHTVIERARGRLDRGLGIKTAIKRRFEPPREHLGAPSAYVAGDWVQVKTDVATTLDDRDRTRGLLFTNTQRETIGGVFRVAKQVRRLRDDHGQYRPISRTVLLAGVDCAGHGADPAGCGRHCPMMYRDEWLQPAAAPTQGAPHTEATRSARVRPLDDIRAGLDVFGRRNGLTFMPEMAQYAGKRFAVANRITTVFEYDRWVPTRQAIYILEGLNCAGNAVGDKGPCDRACSLMWAEDWLLLDA
jgi:CelD/BcsL family acetyltransferase involved in cellulose biosynthesis